MLQAAIAQRKRSGQNIRALAAELGCSHSTLFQSANGKIRPPMKHLERWSLLFEKPEDRDRFIRLGAATKLGDAADRALSTSTTYATADLEAQLAEAHRRIAQLEGEIAELRARRSDNTAMRELTAMLDPDEANPPAHNTRAPAVAGRPRRGR